MAAERASARRQVPASCHAAAPARPRTSGSSRSMPPRSRLSACRRCMAGSGFVGRADDDQASTRSGWRTDERQRRGAAHREPHQAARVRAPGRRGSATRSSTSVSRCQPSPGVPARPAMAARIGHEEPEVPGGRAGAALPSPASPSRSRHAGARAAGPRPRPHSGRRGRRHRAQAWVAASPAGQRTRGATWSHRSRQLRLRPNRASRARPTPEPPSRTYAFGASPKRAHYDRPPSMPSSMPRSSPMSPPSATADPWSSPCSCARRRLAVPPRVSGQRDVPASPDRGRERR